MSTITDHDIAEAKRYLKRAQHIDKRIEQRIEEHERLLTLVSSPRKTNLSGMPRGGQYDWTDAIDNVIELADEIKEEIRLLCKIKREINEAINSVGEVGPHMVLRYRYIDYDTFEGIAEKMACSVQWVYKMHNAGLEAVAELLKGGGDSV